MKVKHLKFENHPVLGDLDIDFTDEATGEPLDIIAFVGDNGTGKTKILESIVGHKVIKQARKELKIDFDVEYEDEVEYKSGEKLPIVWFPVSLPMVDNIVKQKKLYKNPDFDFVIQEELHIYIEDASFWKQTDLIDFLRAKMNKVAQKIMMHNLNRSVYLEEVDNINRIFELMNLGIEFIGLADDENQFPVFKNKQGIEVGIDKLSSGEKQILFRLLNLKRLNVNNSIIIIDEPETSLHPEWQRKIIEVYKNIGENNQIIIATHSPLIIGSVPSAGVKVLSRNQDNGKIEVTDGFQTYGKNADDILRSPMNLTTLRQDVMEEKLKKARQMLRNDQYESDEFIALLSDLENELNSSDTDLMLIKLGVSKRRHLRDKDK